MNELATEEMESNTDPIRQEASGRPLQTMRTHTRVPRTWYECEAIHRDLTGRPLEWDFCEHFHI